MMKTISIATGLALMLAVAPAEAKHGNNIKTVVGCIGGAPHHYQLSTTTKKGKVKVYDSLATVTSTGKSAIACRSSRRRFKREFENHHVEIARIELPLNRL